jgi:hypothetical protein
MVALAEDDPKRCVGRTEDVEMSNMWKHKKIATVTLVSAVLASSWLIPVAIAQKASVPRPQDTLALGEDAVAHLLLLMEPDKNGKITKQDWMRFMGEEFDRLDKDKKGELDPLELHRLNPLVKHAPSENLGK